MPTKAAELLDRLGIEEAQRGWDDAVWKLEDGGEVDVESIKRGLKEGTRKESLFPPPTI